MKNIRLGDVLIEFGYITAEQLKNGVKLRKGKKVFHKAVLAC